MGSIRSFSALCDFSGAKYSVILQIGYPDPEHHPLHFQSESLGKTRGGRVPENIMQSLVKIYALAMENNVDFPELAEYAIKNASNANNSKSIQSSTPKTKTN